MAAYDRRNVSEDDPSSRLLDFVVTVNRVYSALVIIIGTLGNLYCIYVIRSTSLRKFSSSQYLTALACSDLGFLISLALTWLSGAGVRWYHATGVCQMANYASYVCCFLSAWYIVCLTAERCVVIYRPFYARTVASPKRARMVICLITAVGLAMNGFILILVDSQPLEERRSSHESIHHHEMVHEHSDFVLDAHAMDSEIRASADVSGGSAGNPWMSESERMGVGEEDEVRRHFAADPDGRWRPIDVTNVEYDSNASISERTHRIRSAAATRTPSKLVSRNSTKHRDGLSSSSSSVTSRQSRPHFCLERTDTSDLYDIFNTLDMVFSFSLPLLFTFILNVLIGIRLIRVSRERKDMLACASSASFGPLQSAATGGGGSASILADKRSRSPVAPVSELPSAVLARNDETCFSTVLYNKGNQLAVTPPTDLSRRFSVNLCTTDRDGLGPEAENGVTKPLMAAFRKHYNRMRANSITATMGSGGSTSSTSLEKERHITVFLVSISLTHLILNLPSYLYRLIFAVSSAGSSSRNGESQEDIGEVESVVLSVLYLLFYTQFAVNFILYSCQSGKIRRHSIVRRFST